MSSNSGLNLTNLGRDSLLRSRRDFFFAPIAATANKLVTTVDPSGVSVGGTFTLVTYANGLLQRRARRITMTINDDDAGGGLNVRVRLTGQRWGVNITEILDATATDTNDTVATSVNVYDEVTEILLLAKTADTGDDVVFGIDGTSFGLDFPVDNIEDVQAIVNTSTNTEAAQLAISSTYVIAGENVPSGGSLAGASYIQGITLATTDRWEVRYLSSLKVDYSGVIGAWR